MNKLIALWKKLIEDNKFLKILSVVIALVIWVCIVSFASPVNEKTFMNVPVEISFDGSVPDRNGLIMTTELPTSVVVTVNGQRSSLLGVSASDIRVTPSLNSVTEEGTYQLTLEIQPLSGITATVTPAVIPVRFETLVERELPVTAYRTSGFPDGYHTEDETVTPQTVVVRGPKDAVEAITEVRAEYAAAGIREDFEFSVPLRFLNNSGVSVDTRYLSPNADKATVSGHVFYEAAVPLGVTFKNTFGGNETYISASWSQDTLTLRGSADAVRAVKNLSCGEIALETVNNGVTKKFDLTKGTVAETLAGLTVTDMPKSGTVTLLFSLPKTQLTTVTFTAEELNALGLLPEGKAFTSGATVIVRTQVADAVAVTKEALSPALRELTDGTAHLSCTVTSLSAYGIMADVTATVN